MKSREKSIVSLKNICFLSSGTGLVLLLLRIYQTLSLTDGNTGFFTENNISVILMYVFAAAAVIIPLILCFICPDLPSGELKRKPSFLYVFSVIFFALSLVIDGKNKLSVFLAEKGEFAFRKEAIGGNIGLIVMVFSFLAALSLLLSLVIYIKKGTLTGSLKISMLFPVIWAFGKTLGFFSVTVSYLKVVSLLLTIFAFAFLMIFLFENARIVTGVGRNKSVWLFFATGLICAALCFSAGIPSLLAHIIAPEKEIMYCPYDLTLITAGLYAVASVISVFFGEKVPVQTAVIAEENNVTENG